MPVLPGGPKPPVYSGRQLGPDQDYVDAAYGNAPQGRRGGTPFGYGAPAAPAGILGRPSGVPSNTIPASADFDPSASTPTRSSYNFRRSVLNNNALKKAQSAARAEERAAQRAQAGVQGPAELRAAGMGVPAGASIMSNGDYAGETSSPATSTPITGGMPTGVPVPARNPYAGFQGPGTTVPQVPVQNPANVAASGGFRRSGLPMQGYQDRQMAMEAAPGRIHAVLPADMAQNLAQNSAGRDDTRIARDEDTAGGPYTENAVVNRYVGPGVPSFAFDTNRINAAAEAATARTLEAQSAGQMALAGNPDPLDRAVTAELAGAQAQAITSGAEAAATDSRALRAENADLRQESRLYQQGSASAGAQQQRVTGAALVAGMKSTDPNVRAAAERKLLEMLAGSGEGNGGGTSPSAPSTGTAPQAKQLDEATAAQFLQQAGGDKNKAREMARAAGYSF